MTRYGGQPAPDVPQPITKTKKEIDAREQAGWVLKQGFPAIYNENYEIGKFTYYADINVTPGGMVWRIPTNQL